MTKLNTGASTSRKFGVLLWNILMWLLAIPAGIMWTIQLAWGILVAVYQVISLRILTILMTWDINIRKHELLYKATHKVWDDDDKNQVKKIFFKAFKEKESNIEVATVGASWTHFIIFFVRIRWRWVFTITMEDEAIIEQRIIGTVAKFAKDNADYIEEHQDCYVEQVKEVCREAHVAMMRNMGKGLGMSDDLINSLAYSLKYATNNETKLQKPQQSEAEKSANTKED